MMTEVRGYFWRTGLALAVLYAASMGMNGDPISFRSAWANLGEVPDRDPVAMITIPSGPFLMGNQAGVGRQDEQPQRRVYLNAFAIDRYEVTNARYLRFVRETGHRFPPNPYGAGVLESASGIENLPAVQVSWYDAVSYCQWAGKRLPTEAEWEKAARGTDGRLFPWGMEPATARHATFDREWVEEETLHPVGARPAGRSPYGVDDMAGNAREWVRDWYDPAYYASAPSRNPTGPEHGVVRVIRGGSWHSPITDIRATARGKGGFALRTHGTGFRCARNLDRKEMPVHD